MKTLFKSARILTMNEDEEIFVGDVIVTDNRISYVGPSIDHQESFDRIIDCSHYLLMPTFKNCHAHSAMVFLRSLADDLPTGEWLTKYCFPCEDNIVPEDIYELNKLAYLEYVSGGIGTVNEMYFYPSSSIKSANEFGMRTVLNETITSYLNVDQLAELYKELDSQKGLLSLVFCVHAEYTVSEEDVDNISRLVHKYKVPFFTHCSETREEVEKCYKKRGISPVEYFNSKGLFDYGGGIYHGVWLSDYDIKILKEKNVAVIINASSNAKLASGVANVEKLRANGITLCIGTDGAASNNSLDMFKEMTLIYSLAKLTNMNPEAGNPIDILKMATVNGARVLGLNDCDVIATDKLADIMLLDLNQPNMQPMHNIVKNIVYAGNKSNVYMTMIDGKIVYENGQYGIDVDIDDIYEQVQTISDRLTKGVK